MQVTTTAQIEDQVRRRDIGSSASTATHQWETGMQPAMKAGKGKGRLAAHEQGVLLPVQPAAKLVISRRRHLQLSSRR